MDKKKQLYDLYLSKGLITEATTFDKFSTANEDQLTKLYDLGKSNQLFETTDFDTFKTAWTPTEQDTPVAEPIVDPLKKKDSPEIFQPDQAVVSESESITSDGLSPDDAGFKTDGIIEGSTESYEQNRQKASEKFNEFTESGEPILERIDRQVSEIEATEAIRQDKVSKREQEIEDLYIPELAKRYGITEDKVRKNLPKFALQSEIEDPDGTFDQAGESELKNILDVDISALDVRSKLAAQEIKNLGEQGKQKRYKEVMSASNGDEKVAQQEFKQEMDDIGMKFISPEDIEIKNLKEEIYNLEQVPDQTEEELTFLKTKRSELDKFVKEGLIGGNDMFDPATGQFVSGNTKDQAIIDFNKEVDENVAKYRKSDKGTLEKQRDDLYFQYQNYVNDVMVKQPLEIGGLTRESFVARAGLSDPYNTQGLGIKFPDEFKRMVALEQYDKGFTGYKNLILGNTGGEGDGSEAFKLVNSGLWGSKATDKANTILANYIAVNRMLTLNEDPGSVQESEGFEGFVKNVGIGLKESLGVQSSSPSLVADRAINNLEGLGYNMTLDQRDKLDKTMGQKIGGAVGSSIPVSLEIGFNIFLANKAAGVAKLPQLAQALAGGNKAKQFGLTMLYETGIQSAAFVASGESAASGAGEGVGQVIGSALLKKFKLNNKLLNFGVRAASGATTETIAEYSGQFLEELTENGFDWQKASEETFGKTADEAIEKAILTMSVAGVMGFGGAAQESNLFPPVLEKEILSSKLNSPILNFAKEMIASEKGTSYKFKEGKTEGEMSEIELTEKLNDPGFVEKLKSGEVQLNLENPSAEIDAKTKEIFPEDKTADIEAKRQEEIASAMEVEGEGLVKPSETTREGVEKIDKVGSKYNEGDLLTAEFSETPEGYESGEVGVVVRQKKPQINTDGEMTQSAEVTVMQFESLEEGQKYIEENPVKVNPKRIERINEKYDAEISALSDEKSTVAITDGTSESAENIEEKKSGVQTLLDVFRTDNKVVQEQVGNATKALTSISPETKIVVHNTSDEHIAAGGEQGQSGRYDPETNTIHINPDIANERTVAHETFHAILVNKGVTNKQAQAVTSRMVDAVKKSASPELIQKLEEYGTKYDSPLQSEESIAELFGTLASEYKTLPKPTQNLVKRWLDRLAKFFKLKPFTDSEVIEMLNTVSSKIQKGETVTKRDVKILKGDGKTTVTKSQKVDRPTIESVREAAIKNDVSEKDMVEALLQLGYTKAEINSTKKKTVEDAINKAKLSEKRGSDKAKSISSAVADLQSTNWYRMTSDIKREEAVREVKKALGEKTKKAPSVKKITGDKSKRPTQTKTVKALRKEFWTGWNKAYRESKIDQDKKRKELSEKVSAAIKKTRGDATIKKKKIDAIQKRIGKVNLNNPVHVERLMMYVEKVMDSADHIAKISEANKNISKIRRMIKSKKRDANLSASAKSFLMIDPNLVDDIDTYLEYSRKIAKGLAPTSITSEKNNVSEKFNVIEVDQYTEKTSEEQQNKIDVMDFTEKEVEEGLSDKEKEVIEKKNIKKAYDAYSAIVLDMAKTNKDPFTGESLGLEKSEIDLATRLANLDIDSMNHDQAVKAIDALSNFTVNQSLAGTEAVVKNAEGDQSNKKLAGEGVASRPLRLYFSKKLGRTFAEQITSLPIVLYRMFGKTKARMVSKVSGLSGVINGNAKAVKQASVIINTYLKKFGKTKPNGEVFNSASNINERGLVAFMSRTVAGNEEAEFTRRKGWLDQTIEKLSNGTEVDQKLSKEYKEVYDKLLKGSNNINDVIKKADKTNVSAVNWWVDEWAKHYDQFKKVNLEVYNEILESDSNYTPDVTKTIDLSGEVDMTQSSFSNVSGYLDKKKSGSLMKANKPDKLPKDRYISLKFDMNNANTIQAALTDIHTAADIMKVEGFLNSPTMKEVIKTEEDRKFFKARVVDYVGSVKKSNYSDHSEMNNLSKGVEGFASKGTALALGGVTQSLKQSVPVSVNTLINAGRLNLSNLFDPAVRVFLDESGMGIANRGMASQASLDHIERLLEAAAKTTGTELIRKLEDLNRFYLKTFLQKPDVFIARASFMSYYLQYLKRNGKPTKNIDWATHEKNQDGLDYAQQQVDLQQNVSDEYLQGKLFTDKNAYVKFVRKVAFTFANFTMNQKARLHADVIALAAKTTSSQDRKSAMRSLAGLSTEMFMFYGMRILIATAIWEGVKLAFDYDESDDSEKARFDNHFKGAATGMVKDFLSPLPILDDPMMVPINKLLNLVQGNDSNKDKKNFELYGAYDSGVFSDWGAMGITLDKIGDMLDKSELAVTGKYEDRWGKEHELTQLDQGNMKTSAVLSILYNIGLAPAELGTAADYIEKMAKKRSKKAKKK